MASIYTVFLTLLLARLASSGSCFGRRCGGSRVLRSAGRIVFNTPTGNMKGKPKNLIIVLPWSPAGRRQQFPPLTGSGIGRIWSSSQKDEYCSERGDKVINSQCYSVPGPPSFINVTDVSSTSVVVHWGIPYQTNGHIIRYEVEYRPTNTTEEEDKKPVPVDVKGQSRSLRLENLDVNSEYEIEIAAVNFIGRGEAFNSSFRTLVAYADVRYSEGDTDFPDSGTKVPHSLLIVIIGAILVMILSACIFMVAFFRKNKDKKAHPHKRRGNNRRGQRRGQLPDIPVERYKVFYGSKIENVVETKESEARGQPDDFYSVCIQSQNGSASLGKNISEPNHTRARFRDLPQIPIECSGHSAFAGKFPRQRVDEEDFGEVYDETEVDTPKKNVLEEMEKGNVKKGYKESWKLKSNGWQENRRTVKSDTTAEIKKSTQKRDISRKKPFALSWKRSDSSASSDYGEIYDDTSLCSDRDAGEVYDDTELDDKSSIDYYGSSGELYDETEATNDDDFDDFYDDTVATEDARCRPNEHDATGGKRFSLAAMLSLSVSKMRKGMGKLIFRGKLEDLDEEEESEEETCDDIYEDPNFSNEVPQTSKAPAAIPLQNRTNTKTAKAGASGKGQSDTGENYCYEVSKSQMVNQGDSEEFYEETGGTGEEIYEVI